MVLSLLQRVFVLAVSFVCACGFAYETRPVVDDEDHPFYVSVTEINHNQKENMLEISCKVFADDFENTIKAQYKTTIDILNPKDTLRAQKLVSDYLQKHLQLKINGKPVSLQFLGYENESESVWCYLQVSDTNQVKKLEVSNSLLYELDKTQMGIVHAIVGGTRQSTRLVNPNSEAAFQW